MNFNMLNLSKIYTFHSISIYPQNFILKNKLNLILVRQFYYCLTNLKLFLIYIKQVYMNNEIYE